MKKIIFVLLIILSVNIIDAEILKIDKETKQVLGCGEDTEEFKRNTENIEYNKKLPQYTDPNVNICDYMHDNGNLIYSPLTNIQAVEKAIEKEKKMILRQMAIKNLKDRGEWKWSVEVSTVALIWD